MYNFNLLLLWKWAFAHFFFRGNTVSDGNDRQSLKIRIAKQAEKTAASLSMEIVLVELRNDGGRAIIRVYIDQPAGITLDDCEKFSRSFSAAMDVEDFVPFSYVLEVSSPGINRPLVKEADFQRFMGENARVRTRIPIDGQRNFKGRIIEVNDGRLTLQSAPGKQVVITIADIEKAGLIADGNLRKPQKA